MPSDAGHRCEYLTFQACPLADSSSAKLELSPRLSSTSSTSFPFLRSNSLTNLSSICQVSLGITTPLHRAHKLPAQAALGYRRPFQILERSTDGVFGKRGRHLSYQRGKRNTNPGTRCVGTRTSNRWRGGLTKPTV